jgi:hypothetical protein
MDSIKVAERANIAEDSIKAAERAKNEEGNTLIERILNLFQRRQRHGNLSFRSQPL